MPDRPPSTPAPLRTTGGLVPRSNHHAPTDDTSNDPRHHSFGSLSGARANPMAALQAMPRAPSSARLNSDSHAPLVLSSTTTVVYSPAVGRVGIPPQDPGSPTRQRIFELPSSGFPSFTEVSPPSFPEVTILSSYVFRLTVLESRLSRRLAATRSAVGSGPSPNFHLPPRHPSNQCPSPRPRATCRGTALRACLARSKTHHLCPMTHPVAFPTTTPR